ncbi:serine hydrolase [Kangiella sp.]|uniref:serine hydrolase n=1 Tax=Kangiella sp. TaxID=1920245 RepID=UPI003A8D6D28
MKPLKSITTVWGSALLLGLAACASVPEKESSTTKGASAFQAVLEKTYQADAPGATVVVSKDGKVIFSEAYGMADLEMGVAMSEDHILRLASVTKQYAAAAILLLAEQGKLSLDDPLTRFLPDFPADDVTIHHLLNHTSGIASYTSIPGYFIDERIRREVSTDELIAVFAEIEEDFAPGESWRYNNSGYVLLGAIIEKVSGQSWNAYIEEKLLKPASIEHTGYYPDKQVLADRARGYQMADNNPVNAPWLSMTQPHAAGALSATALDVDLWQRALHGGDIISQEMLERMYTPDEAASEAGYGYGLMRGSLHGQLMIYHGGGIHGFNTHALWLPEEKLSVVVLSNYVGLEPRPGDVAQRLAALAINKPFPIELPTAQLSDEALKEVVGVYRINENTSRSLRLVDGEIISQRDSGAEFKVRPVGDDRFVFLNSLSSFQLKRDDHGKVTGLDFYQGGEANPEYAEKISDTVEVLVEIELTPAQMERLVGDYEIQPNFILSIRRSDKGLTGQATGQPAIDFLAYSENMLLNKQIGAKLEFDLEGDKPARGLTLHQGGQKMPAPRVGE